MTTPRLYPIDSLADKLASVGADVEMSDDRVLVTGTFRRERYNEAGWQAIQERFGVAHPNRIVVTTGPTCHAVSGD